MSLKKIVIRLNENRRLRRNQRSLDWALANAPTDASRQEILVISRAA